MDVKTAIGGTLAVASLAAVIVAAPAAAAVDRCGGTVGTQIDDLRAARPGQEIQAVKPGEFVTALYVEGRITVHLDADGYVVSCSNG